jgi:hypothetical protein
MQKIVSGTVRLPEHVVFTRASRQGDALRSSHGGETDELGAANVSSGLALRVILRAPGKATDGLSADQAHSPSSHFACIQTGVGPGRAPPRQILRLRDENVIGWTNPFPPAAFTGRPQHVVAAKNCQNREFFARFYQTRNDPSTRHTAARTFLLT